MKPIETLLRDGPVVVNLGLQDFAESLEAQGAKGVQVEWSPPAPLEDDLADLLEEIE